MTQEVKFIFSGHKWNAGERTAKFFYEIQKGSEKFKFTEVLSFPLDQEVSDVPQELLKNILDNLSLVLGISYYKIFCPREIILKNIVLSKKQAEFWNTVYTKGLGEFFYQNKMDFQGLISFPFTNKPTAAPIAFPRKNRSLVGIGGGKDSIVSAELLKTNGKEFASFFINKHEIRDKIVSLLGEDVICVQKKVDLQLAELNKRKDVYNGHFPISAQYAFIGVLTAALYDYRFIIVSNEHSANYGDVLCQGMEINHQWSKSLEFEELFQEYMKTYITGDITYFSLLRSMSEISIVKQFAKYPKYFQHFASCNRNFTTIAPRSGKKWCGECAKCAFAFIMLAAFIPKEEVISIFGQNLLAKEDLLPIFKELLGVEAFKPFDCVGTPEEVKVGFYLTMQKGEYNSDFIMRFFKEEVLPGIFDIQGLQEKVFTKSSEHRIPEEFQNTLV